MRKLATIQKVEFVKPIDGADRIEVVGIKGWECVTAKGDFKPGDMVIYFEVDSILLDHPLFEFMRPRKFKVKIIKLRGQISMGLVMPVSILKEFTKKKISLEVETDVSEILGVKKYDPQAEKELKQYKQNRKKLNFITSYMMSFQWFRHLRYQLGFETLRNFPYFLPKTDEERIENIPQVLQQWKDYFYISEKLDGMSLSACIYKENKWYSKSKFYVCSRNICLHKENNSEWWEVARKFGIERKLRSYGRNIAVQGEIIGKSIQGNVYKLKELDFYVFNVIDLNTSKRLNLIDKTKFCETYGFKMVPLLESEILLQDFTVNLLAEKANGKSVLGDTNREGLVFRSTINDHLSFKIISPIFLLGQKEEE